MRVRPAVSGALGALGLLAAAVAVSVAWQRPATRPLADACCYYSPARLAGGEVWTVIGSGLLLPQVGAIGPTTLMTAALFLPYALAVGARRSLGVFFAGHVLATVPVAAVILPAAALGWTPALVLRAQPDVGASAGLAAAAGALGMLLGRGRGGLALLAAFALWFTTNLFLTWRLVEVEHLIALAAGVAIEGMRQRGCRGRSLSRRRL